MIILRGGLAAIERAFALAVVGVAPLVPVLSQTLVATILHGPHGVLLRLIDIQHLAAILRLVNIEHLTAANGAAAVRVVLVANGLHL